MTSGSRRNSSSAAIFAALIPPLVVAASAGTLLTACVDYLQGSGGTANVRYAARRVNGGEYGSTAEPGPHVQQQLAALMAEAIVMALAEATEWSGGLSVLPHRKVSEDDGFLCRSRLGVCGGPSLPLQEVSWCGVPPLYLVPVCVVEDSQL